MQTFANRAGRRLTVLGLVATGALMIGFAGTASAAFARDDRLTIGTSVFEDPATQVELGASPFHEGYYHVHIWGGGNDFNTQDMNFAGSQNYSIKVNLPQPVAKGTTLCAELWYHSPSGYESLGAPCLTH